MMRNPCACCLPLLRFTQRSNGKQHAHGFRIITERTQDATAGDATELTKENCYAAVALCTVKKVPYISAAKALCMTECGCILDNSFYSLQHTYEDLHSLWLKKKAVHVVSIVGFDIVRCYRARHYAAATEHGS